MNGTPETLHEAAHRAQLRGRTAQDWWETPLNTALAACSLVRHPPDLRAEAEGAISRLRRWHREGEARRVSADAVALAMAARAAADLGRLDAELDLAAIEGVQDLAQRSLVASPPLHVAMAAWALSNSASPRAIPVREALVAKADELRLQTSTLTRALGTLTRSCSTAEPDINALVRELLAECPSNPRADDGVVWLWLLTVSIERAAPFVSSGDSGFAALTDRRTGLATRLSIEIGDDSFATPTVEDFDPSASMDSVPLTHLSAMEALLLDFALASNKAQNPWLTFAEAEEIFGRRARTQQRTAARDESLLVAGLGATSSTLVAIGAEEVGVPTDVALAGALSVGFGFWLVATMRIHRAHPTKLVEGLGTLWASLAVGAGLVAINQSFVKPPIGDLGGMIGGAIITCVAFLGVRLLSKKS